MEETELNLLYQINQINQLKSRFDQLRQQKNATIELNALAKQLELAYQQLKFEMEAYGITNIFDYTLESIINSLNDIVIYQITSADLHSNFTIIDNKQNNYLSVLNEINRLKLIKDLDITYIIKVNKLTISSKPYVNGNIDKVEHFYYNLVVDAIQTNVVIIDFDDYILAYFNNITNNKVINYQLINQNYNNNQFNIVDKAKSIKFYNKDLTTLVASLNYNIIKILPIITPTLPVTVVSDIEPIETKSDIEPIEIKSNIIDYDKLYRNWQQNKIEDLHQLDLTDQGNYVAIVDSINQAKELEQKLQQCLKININTSIITNYIDEILAYRLGLEDYVNISKVDTNQLLIINANYQKLLTIAINKFNTNFNNKNDTIIITSKDGKIEQSDRVGADNIYRRATKQLVSAGFRVVCCCYFDDVNETTVKIFCCQPQPLVLDMQKLTLKDLALMLFNNYVNFLQQPVKEFMVGKIIEFYQPASKQVLIAIYYNINKIDLYININNKLVLTKSKIVN